MKTTLRVKIGVYSQYHFHISISLSILLFSRQQLSDVVVSSLLCSCHETSIAQLILLHLDARLRCTRLFKRNHKCSMGFNPGLFLGHLSNCMSFYVNHCLQIRAMSQEAWDHKNGVLSGKRSLIESRSFSCRMVLMYFLLFGVSSTMKVDYNIC